jgi:hypothetical protein
VTGVRSQFFQKKKLSKKSFRKSQRELAWMSPKKRLFETFLIKIKKKKHFLIRNSSVPSPANLILKLGRLIKKDIKCKLRKNVPAYPGPRSIFVFKMMIFLIDKKSRSCFSPAKL